MTILVLDLGSSSVRALLFDDQAAPIPAAIAKRPHTFLTTQDGTSIADPEQLRRLAEVCIDDVLSHPASRNIRAVGMATFVANLLGIDSAGSPVTPVYTYADTRSAATLDTLRTQIDLDAVHQRTGCPHHTAYHLSKLHWLHQQGIHADQWIDIGTYLYRSWFGRAVPSSYSVASWTGLFDQHTLTWDADLLRLLGLSESELPPLADYTARQMGLRNEYALRWRSLRDVPFFLAVGDGAAANIGSGAVQRGTAALTIGTTAALRMVTDEPMSRIPDGLWSYRVDAARHLTGGATNEGGSTLGWARETLGITEDFDAQLVGRPADRHGLTFLPLLAGERSPGYRADATGTLHGLRLSTTRLDIVQAVLEGVALRLALIAERLGANAIARIYASGGALQASRAWAQICANALVCTLHLLDEQETTARGVALLAYQALGVAIDSTPKQTTLIQPVTSEAAALREAQQRQAWLYERLYSA